VLVQILYNVQYVIRVRSVLTLRFSAVTNGHLNLCCQITNVKLLTSSFDYFYMLKTASMVTIIAAQYLIILIYRESIL
jgi:hypothetical protein